MAHESLKRIYEEDAKRTEKPYLLWQVRVGGKWENLDHHSAWAAHNQYRRHPHADLVLTYDPQTPYMNGQNKANLGRQRLTRHGGTRKPTTERNLWHTKS